MLDKYIALSEEEKVTKDAQDDESLKADPRTPLFDQCAKRWNFEYRQVLSSCLLNVLDKDIAALNGWFGPSSESNAARQVARNKLAIMKFRELRQRLADSSKRSRIAAERRERQTPLENLLDRINDKLDEPCLYADKDNIMRSCY